MSLPCTYTCTNTGDWVVVPVWCSGSKNEKTKNMDLWGIDPHTCRSYERWNPTSCETTALPFELKAHVFTRLPRVAFLHRRDLMELAVVVHGCLASGFPNTEVFFFFRSIGMCIPLLNVCTIAKQYYFRYYTYTYNNINSKTT